jgi:hypothetical protein
MHKPRATRDIYVESFSVNSSSLEKQLADQRVSPSEIKIIIDAVGRMYLENVDKIVEECDRDMMALEHAPSPLKLFVYCLGRVQDSTSLSQPARALLNLYTSAWEDWM